MKNIITIVQIIISTLLIIVILLQPKGEGLGQTLGGAGTFYKTRRGMEKILFTITVIFIVIFLVSSLLSFLIK